MTLQFNPDSIALTHKKIGERILLELVLQTYPGSFSAKCHRDFRLFATQLLLIPIDQKEAKRALEEHHHKLHPLASEIASHFQTPSDTTSTTTKTSRKTGSKRSRKETLKQSPSSSKVQRRTNEQQSAPEEKSGAVAHQTQSCVKA